MPRQWMVLQNQTGHQQMEKMTPHPKDMPTVVVTTREQLKSLIIETFVLPFANNIWSVPAQ